MRRLLIALSALLAALSCAAADLLIENVTLVSPERSQALPRQHVLIRDERIARISGRPITAPGARRIDGSGRFLAPGLTDTHVHISTPAGLPWDSASPELQPLVDAYMRQQPRSYLYFGVTQLLDLANSPDAVTTFEAQPQRPDLFRCGSTLPLDGYPSVLMDKSVRYRLMPDFIFEPANAAKHPLPAGVDAAAHTPEAIVDRIAVSGASCVKVFIEDGFGDQSDWPMLSRQSLQRLRAAATKRGLLLIAHANALDMQRIALDGKVDVLAHGLWNWGSSNNQTGVPPDIAAHLQRIHRSGTGYQPTLRVLAGTADLFRADTLEDPTYKKVVPAALLDWYGSDAGKWFKRSMKHDYGDLPDAKIASLELQAGERGMRAARYLHELGHPLLLGSDTPSAPTYGNQPGYDTYREMRLMATSGLSAAEVFRAATLNNARQFRLDRDYGTVTAGKIANLLLLKANPLESVRAWSQIDKIILRGQVIERESLAAN
ncbi:amidohydrolase family protein [Povalibacter sp.]|uniref:amidohydrolase family protein n=1 Tax=Povalibacter sp. TaxID=1962978 RepID=UPI002F3E7B18